MLIRLVPGQAGQKGTLEATQAAPDGYTLVYTDNYRDQLHRFTFRIDKYETNEDLAHNGHQGTPAASLAISVEASVRIGSPCPNKAVSY